MPTNIIIDMPSSKTIDLSIKTNNNINENKKNLITPLSPINKRKISSTTPVKNIDNNKTLTPEKLSPSVIVQTTNERRMSAATTTSSRTTITPTPSSSRQTPSPKSSHDEGDSDEVKVFDCEKHEEDIDVDGDGGSDRLSPVIKEEETSPSQQFNQTNLADRLNSDHQFHLFPYLMSPYYNGSLYNGTPPFDKIPTLPAGLGNPLSKFMSPPPAHMGMGLHVDPSTGVPNPMYPIPSPSPFQSLYSSGLAQQWRQTMFPFGFPPGYPLAQFSPTILSQSSLGSLSPLSLSPSSSAAGTHHRMDSSGRFSSMLEQKLLDEKPKKPHIKKPLNAFMLFMKEQRAKVVSECTLRESAAINQILGRKWHELDRAVQQKYYDMARDERLRHMQLYPGWSARDNYGVRKKRGGKGKKREKVHGENGECVNQKKCRARFGLDQQGQWCKHCKRKKKCIRFTEEGGDAPSSVNGGNDTTSNDEEDDMSGYDEDTGDSDEENKQHQSPGQKLLHSTKQSQHHDSDSTSPNTPGTAQQRVAAVSSSSSSSSSTGAVVPPHQFLNHPPPQQHLYQRSSHQPLPPPHYPPHLSQSHSLHPYHYLHPYEQQPRSSFHTLPNGIRQPSALHVTVKRES